MKKKIVLGLGVGAMSLGLLTGCGNQEPIFFEGKKLPVTQVEEIISDRLEDENGIEFNVNISEDTED